MARGQIRAAVASCTAVAMPDPLTHSAKLGIKPVSSCRREVADPTVSQQELQALLLFFFFLIFKIFLFFAS